MPFVVMVIVALPFDFAVTFPPEVTAATVLSEETNFALPILPVIFSLKLLPFLSVFLTALREGFFTVTVKLFSAPLFLTMIFAVPFLSAVTTPFELTFATFELLLLYVVLPFELRILASVLYVPET